MSIDGAKKSRGRPTVDSHAINVRIERSLLDSIDAFASAEPDAPTRPEAIRRLVEKGLGESPRAPRRSTADVRDEEEHADRTGGLEADEGEGAQR